MPTGLEQFRRGGIRQAAPNSPYPSTPLNYSSVTPTPAASYTDRDNLHPGLRPVEPPKNTKVPNDRDGLVPLPLDGTPGPGLNKPLPPPVEPPIPTGYPPTPTAPTPPTGAPPMSTGYPPLTTQPLDPNVATGQPQPNSPYPNTGITNSQVNPQELTSVNLQQLLASDSPYIQAATRAGERQAASRGMLNSSMAAGAARRAAIEAGLPIAGADAQAYQGAANQTRDFIYRDALANNDTARQDWLASSAYNRDFNGRLALMPIASGFDFFNRAMQMALEDPSVYPPEVINGMSQFNMEQLNNLIAQYLGGGG